jgi:AraC family transcriptional regulator
MRTEQSSPGGIAVRACSNGATSAHPARTITGCRDRLPPPLLSSRSLGWDGIVVELRCASNLDVVLPYPDHVICVILGGGGTLWQSRGGRIARHTVRPGEVIITPAGEPKRWQHIDDIVAVVLRLSRPYLDKLAAEQDERHREGVEIDDAFSIRDTFVQQIAMRFLKALEPQSPASRADIDGLVRSLCVHLLDQYAVERSVPAPRFRTMPPGKLRRALDYIEANLHLDLSVAHIAEQVTMSESHFSHVFRETVGLPPHRYLRDRRIERAKALLRECDMPLSEIAQRVGCSSASNFSVLFHGATGTTPRTYRNAR